MELFIGRITPLILKAKCINQLSGIMQQEQTVWAAGSCSVVFFLTGPPGCAGYGNISHSRPFLPIINWMWQIVLLWGKLYLTGKIGSGRAMRNMPRSTLQQWESGSNNSFFLFKMESDPVYISRQQRQIIFIRCIFGSRVGRCHPVCVFVLCPFF